MVASLCKHPTCSACYCDGIFGCSFGLGFYGRFSRLDLRSSIRMTAAAGLPISGDRHCSPLLVAQGVVLAGMMADRVFFMGANLPQFKLELIKCCGWSSRWLARSI